MKKALAILLAAAMAASLAACGKTEQPAADTATTANAETTAVQAEDDLPRLIINNEPYVVTTKDGFDNAGVTGLICDATETYAFKASDAETTWTVFVFDQPFTDGARYLAQAKIPDMIGDGTLRIEAGKYIYILCSESAFTADAPSDAALTIDYAEGA